MATTKHTPGPWVDWRRDDGAFHIGTSAPKVYVCRIIGDEHDDEVQANAHLIAAAPALLAALKTLLNIYTMDVVARGNPELTNTAAYQEARTAILAAESRSW